MHTRAGRPAAPALPAAAQGSLSAQWAALDPRSVTLSGENRLIDGPGASGGLRFDAAGGQWRVTVARTAISRPARMPSP